MRVLGETAWGRAAKVENCGIGSRKFEIGISLMSEWFRDLELEGVNLVLSNVLLFSPCKYCSIRSFSQFEHLI